MSELRDLMVTLYFLRRDQLYQKVKPYNLEYASDNLPISNLKTHKVEHLAVKDLRGIEHEFNFDRNGFAVLDLQSAMTYEDFEDPEKVEKTYCRELGACLLKYMQATSVQVFDAQTRYGGVTRPFLIQPSILKYEISQQFELMLVSVAFLSFELCAEPSADATGTAIKSIIEFLNKDKADNLLRGRYIYVNVWKPLKGPVQDWPLALCDAASVDPHKDFVAHDTVFAETVRENMMVHFSPQQRWYYLSNQLPSELLVFRQVDSELKPAVPHASFINPIPSSMHTASRESIEVRAIVYFDEQ